MPKKTSACKNIMKSTELFSKTGSIFYDKNGNIVLKILAKPGSKNNSITDISTDGIGVQINAPPVDGEANTELIKFLSHILEIRKSYICLDRGSKSRLKTVIISANTSNIDEIKKKLESAIN